MDLSTLLLFSMPGGPELIIIVLVLVLLFGGRKIPELMKGLGQGMKEFKKARNEVNSDNKNKDKENKESIDNTGN
ncbi:MAG: twin-arginine translocase TatA/TatE family subunit [Marinilabiliaceae bacterium]|nr:twin-arginine translocase TatA/TatE family subunit [Marinilabiliaceae bacterium]